MRVFGQIGRDWRGMMNIADRTRVILAFSFIFGALCHFGWVGLHGDLLYYGPAPRWAPFFWYSICVVDFVVAWLLLAHPRPGIVLGVTTMVATLAVNWTQFPTFQFGFNYVLVGLTVFGCVLFGAAPWLWRASRWRLNQLS